MAEVKKSLSFLGLGDGDSGNEESGSSSSGISITSEQRAGVANELEKLVNSGITIEEVEDIISSIDEAELGDIAGNMDEQANQYTAALILYKDILDNSMEADDVLERLRTC